MTNQFIIDHLNPQQSTAIPWVRPINRTNPVIMWQGLLLLLRRHCFYILELKHPFLQKRSHQNPQMIFTNTFKAQK
jgi:hypothetical protein